MYIMENMPDQTIRFQQKGITKLIKLRKWNLHSPHLIQSTLPFKKG